MSFRCSSRLAGPGTAGIQPVPFQLSITSARRKSSPPAPHREGGLRNGGDGPIGTECATRGARPAPERIRRAHSSKSASRWRLGRGAIATGVPAAGVRRARAAACNGLIPTMFRFAPPPYRTISTRGPFYLSRIRRTSRSMARISSRIPASISPTNPKPKRTTPEITSTMIRSRRGRNPMCGGPYRR